MIHELRRALRLEDARVRRAVLVLVVVAVTALFILTPVLGVLDAASAGAAVAAITLLLVAVILDHVANLDRSPSVQVFPDENAALSTQVQIIEHSDCRYVRLLEYSALSIDNLLSSMTSRKGRIARVQLLIRHPAAAESDYQLRSRVLHGIIRLPGHFPPELLAATEVEIRCYSQPASLRGRDFGGRHIAIGWYTHEMRSDRPADTRPVWGRGNSLIVADSRSESGLALQTMFDRVFASIWQDATPLADAIEPFRAIEPNLPSTDWLKSVGAAN